MDVVTAFVNLFAGSTTGYGTEEGGCDKDLSRSYYERVLNHLEGDHPMGVYPLHRYTDKTQSERGWGVNWGCIDFDEGEDKSLAYALNVQKVVALSGGTAWVERSRSKGYHVWVFLKETLPAALVRESLLGACQTVGAPTKEINPKSVELAEGQVGNYVRLPYPGGLEPSAGFPKDRRTMLLEGRDIPCEQFVEQATLSLTGVEAITSLHALYEPPRRVVPTPVGPVGQGDIYKRMSGIAYTVYKNGPLQNSGRGHTLFKLACLLAEGGNHSMSDALALCLEADQRWGKFKDRTNGHVTIEGIVRKAYGV